MKEDILKRREMMFEEGLKYLKKKGKDQVTDELIELYLKDYERRKSTQINGKDGLFYKMIEHARNRQRMSNTVDYKPRLKSDVNYDPNLDYEFCYLNETLFNFDPKKVLNEYRYYNSELQLFSNIKIGISELSKENPNNQGLKDLKNSKSLNKENPNYWVSFSKSIISIAEFLSRFNNINEFNKFIKEFDIDDEKRIYLALQLGNEIYGYGFALACDFLKENCSQEYVKPDTHIIKLFTNRDIVEKLDLKISQETMDKAKEIEDSQTNPDKNNKKKSYSTKNLIEIFRAVKDYSESIDKLPYEVDKLFWLIGSGKLYRIPYIHETKDPIKTNIEDFIKKFSEKLT
ncbi:hypothetical protein DU43_18405 [Methanosarcina mazei]|uniref:Uncharacterized protein n=1 Tax=Methanosarcina mazei TaxID=2209 RepID=A0A0F8GZR1_METMZ|nr:hypothetical protein [Methanosarcina mazei]KKG69846.1 hypothetical protein DU43_18405 [Methanosarcina mazei]